MLNFIHIPKNAGSFIKRTINVYNFPIRYINHYFDTKINTDNSFIIVRNPVDRFCSAVNFAISKYPNTPAIRQLIKNNIVTPEQWAHMLQNTNHSHHNLVLNEICNSAASKHSIDNCFIPFKFTYTSQCLWIKSAPKYVIMFDNLSEEFSILCEKLFEQKPAMEIINKSSKIDNELSCMSKKFIYNFYREDFNLYNFYRKQKISDRLP